MSSSPELSPPAPVVEVFYPSSAPHLQAIAAEIQAKQRRELEAMTPAQLNALIEMAVDVERDRAAFAKFRSKLGLTQTGE